MKKTSKKKKLPERVNAVLDSWSTVHFLSGILLGWTMSPLLAVVLMIAWEPLERYVLSPLLAKVRVNFGYETLRNSLSDIMVDCAGIFVGALLLTWLVAPPFHLF